MTISIVIPNYNTWDLVKRNIDACLQLDGDLISEIIVVDDCSPQENYLDFDSRVKIIRNPTNFRYTKAVNQGLKAAQGDLVILLDSDAYPTHPYLAQLIAEYQDNPNLGCVGFKTINDRGEDSGNYITEPSILSLISGQKLHGLLRKYNVFSAKHIMPFSCAVSFRKACLEELNYLDEQFEVLDADQDMSMRIHRSKWRLSYDANTAIYHVGGGSIPKDHRRVLLFYQSRWDLLKKHNKLPFPRFSAFLILGRLRLEQWILSKQNKQKAQDRAIIIQELKKTFYGRNV